MDEKNFSEKSLESALLPEAAKSGDRGVLLWPLRVALSGRKTSPSPFEIAAVLGKQKTLERIRKAIMLVQKP
jgi:glutamyl/glutaminyl-tRNA synthetase